MHTRSLGMPLGILISAGMLAAQSAPIPARISERLTANGLKADVSFLASDALEGRGTPSRGLDVAAEYIAAQFRRAGLEPAGDDGYFQTANFVNVIPNTGMLRLAVESGGKQIAASFDHMALTDPAALDLAGAAAYLADPATVDQAPAEQVRGKVLILRAAAGARARVNPATLARLRPALIVTLTAGVAGNAGARLREAGAEATPALAVWDPEIRAVFDAAKPGPLEATVSAHIAPPESVPVKLHNVIGVLRGSDPALRDTYVLVTAHYDHLGIRGTGPGDHIYNGANDDASGTACVIEMAQALAALPERPKRSIVFMALFGEELGLVGSRYYGRHPVFPLAKTIADLNLEQMGRTDDNSGPRVGIVNVTGYDYTSITPVLAKAGAEFDIRVMKDEQASDPFFARSDNQALADAGIPAHTLSVGYVFPDYHQPGDEWPKIDYDNMARVDRTAALAVFRLADSLGVPVWNEANPKTERYVKAQKALTDSRP
ncbi:MAG TPA: M28 family peptidase [Bryobacteraceae bacterium]|nr:M28 family peptidase [Bryobacteraceae bacterium]